MILPKNILNNFLLYVSISLSCGKELDEKLIFEMCFLSAADWKLISITILLVWKCKHGKI